VAVSKVKLSYKQTIAWRALVEENAYEEVFMGGAAGPGKTWLGCLWQIYSRINFEDTRGFMGRLTRKQLYDTTLETFFKVARDIYNLEQDKDFFFRSQDGRINFSNGSFIYLQEMRQKPSDRDFHRFGSLELTDAFVDEAPEISETALEILMSRIRHNLINDMPKTLAAGNPANNWAKLRWISDEYGNPVKLKNHQLVVRALLHDNPDKEFRKTYLRNLKKLPSYQRARLLDGNWDIVENEQPFFTEFKRSEHTTTGLEDDKISPLWISFDFNVDPTVCIVAQIQHNTPVVIAEHLVTSEGTHGLCQKLKHYKNRRGAIYITGDFSGNTRHTSANQTDYQIIKRELRIPSSHFKNTSTANKDHKFSRDLCNYVFMSARPLINDSCLGLISDLENAQAKDDGKLRKDRDTFKMDLCDAFRYLCDAWFPKGMKDVDKLTFKQLD
jgi:hypothetical protein